MNLKRRILKSPFAKIVLTIQASILAKKIASANSVSKNHKTVYLISPYKTGTTYISDSFNPAISQHEPLQYLSFIKLEKDFDDFFIRRMNYLNLKLECSGFWSAYINELAQNNISKDLNYICILRSPSSWVTSVLNHWNSPGLTELGYDYINDFFWKRKVGVDLQKFNKANKCEKQQIIDRLITFYFDFTNNTCLLNNVTYIELKDLDKNLFLVGSLIEETSHSENSRKRESKLKNFVYINEEIDREYEQLTSGYTNKTIPS